MSKLCDSKLWVIRTQHSKAIIRTLVRIISNVMQLRLSFIMVKTASSLLFAVGLHSIEMRMVHGIAGRSPDPPIFQRGWHARLGGVSEGCINNPYLGCLSCKPVT